MPAKPLTFKGGIHGDVIPDSTDGIRVVCRRVCDGRQLVVHLSNLEETPIIDFTDEDTPKPVRRQKKSKLTEEELAFALSELD